MHTKHIEYLYKKCETTWQLLVNTATINYANEAQFQDKNGICQMSTVSPEGAGLKSTV